MKQYFTANGNGVLWKVKPDEEHINKIPMEGFGLDYLVSFGVKRGGEAVFSRYMMFPTLRTIPNDTHATWRADLPADKTPRIVCGGTAVTEKAVSFYFDGVLRSDTEGGGLLVKRLFYPAKEKLCAIEQVTVRNNDKKSLDISLDTTSGTVFCVGRGTKGVYVAEIMHDIGDGVSLNPGAEHTFSIQYTARIANTNPFFCNAENELELRRKRVSELCGYAVMETGDIELDTLFRLSKLHAGESIFRLSCGLLHSPGGTCYYAASWANDQLEYAAPWFSFFGDDIATESMLTAIRQYIPFMWRDYTRIPCSVICEGQDIWEAAGDRGDAEMFLYGVSRFVMTLNRSEITREFLSALEWCAEYIERAKLPEGVIGSDTDELEGRFPTDGKANLYTSSLAFKGLKNLSLIEHDLGFTDKSKLYAVRAAELEKCIEDYFGEELHGFHTYRYSKGINTLRAWVISPCNMGIDERADGSLAAVFSDYLSREGGILSCELGSENSEVQLWDRAALYAFIAMFRRGASKLYGDKFTEYVRARLTGEAAPFPFEMWPTPNIMHLSAESALFCRVIAEGMLGFENTGLGHFSLCPKLPDGIGHINIESIRLCGHLFSVRVVPGFWSVTIDSARTVTLKPGQSYTF